MSRCDCAESEISVAAAAATTQTSFSMATSRSRAGVRSVTASICHCSALCVSRVHCRVAGIVSSGALEVLHKVAEPPPPPSPWWLDLHHVAAQCTLLIICLVFVYPLVQWKIGAMFRHCKIKTKYTFFKIVINILQNTNKR